MTVWLFALMVVAGSISVVLSSADTLAGAHLHRWLVLVLRLIAAGAAIALTLCALTGCGRRGPEKCRGQHCTTVRPYNWENLPRNDVRVVCDDRCTR